MDAETPIERDEGVSSRPEHPSAGEPVEHGSAPRRGADLRSALRVARIEDAERSRAIADVRSAEIARLDLLREAIEPMLAQVPRDVEMFDAGLIPVPQPRLFIDMIAFVEMAHDKHVYRFVQDTRQGRVRIAESERLDVMRDAITAYVARRLVEREKALAIDAAPPLENLQLTRARHAAAAYAARSRFAWLRVVPSLILNYLGVVAICVLVWVLGDAIYHYVIALHS